MAVFAILRASVALLFCMAAAVSDHAYAQTYDGAGLLRFGAYGQFASTDFDINEPIDARGSASGTSFGGGGTFGYDWLFQSGWLLGIEGDLGFDTFEESHAGRKYHVDYLATVRGRAGAYVHPDLLLYGTAGLAILGVDFDGLVDPLTGTRFGETDSLVGWTVGAGVEYDWHGFILFGEYLFASYEDFSFKEPFDDGQTITLINNNIDVDQQIFRFGVKFVIGQDHREEYLGGCCGY